MSIASIEEVPVVCEEERPRAVWVGLSHAKNLVRGDILASALLIPVTIGLCFWWGVNPNLDIGLYFVVAFALILFGGIPTFVIFGLRCLIRGRPASIGGPPRTWTFLVNVLALVVMSWIVTHIKAGALLGETCDDHLRYLERAVLGGWEAWAWLRSIIPIEYAGFFTFIYWTFKPLILGTILWLILVCKTKRANELTCAVVLGYFIGSFAYHLLPSYGPAYMDPAASPEALSQRVASVQQLLLHHTQEVQRDPGGAVIVPWKYIGAFPSLHMSHVLILVWYMRYSRMGLGIYGLFAFFTGISTLYLGWHYLIDLVGGVGVAALAIWMTQRSDAWLTRCGTNSERD